MESAPALTAPHRLLSPVLMGLMVWAGYLVTVNGVASPFLAKSFGLDDAGISFAFGFMSLDAIPTLLLTRRADRGGRRSVLLAACTTLPAVTLLAALAPSLSLYVMVQILRGFLTGTTSSMVIVMFAEMLPLEQRARGLGRAGVAGALGGGLALVVVSALEAVPGTWRWAWALAALPAVALPLVWRVLPRNPRLRVRGGARRDGVRPYARALRAAASPRRAGTRRQHLPGQRARGRGGELGLLPRGTHAQPVGHDRKRDPLRRRRSRHGGVLARRLDRRSDRAQTDARTRGRHRAARLARIHGAAGNGSILSSVRLGLAFAALSVAGNAALTAGRALGSELFPTKLRSTYYGWAYLAESSSVIVGQFLVATLAVALGGLASAILWLQLLVLPSLAIFWYFVPETLGRDLDEG